VKRDLRRCRFTSFCGWRGDSLVCPQAFGGDCWGGCSMGCWWCFCREMEEELYTKYYTGWDRALVRPARLEDFERLFGQAFDSSTSTTNWLIHCLRAGLPFNMGSKAETFCLEDLDYRLVEKVLALFLHYRVPVIFETKSQYIGLKRYLDIIRELNCAVIVSILGGTDSLCYRLEPGAPVSSSRWTLVRELNRLGVWTAVRWEPILPGINSQPEVLESYVDQAQKAGARHISFFNYRTSLATRAQHEFESRGYNYLKMLEGNLEENWRPIGQRMFELCRERGVKCSTPDFVNFPFDSDCESCCGVDGKFPPYQFTFMHACRVILQKGSVCWDDMEEIEFREPEAYTRMRDGWNGRGQYYSLADCVGVRVLGRDAAGMNIYGRGNPPARKGMLW